MSSLSFNGPKLLNNLDSETRQAISLSVFQSKVFNFLSGLNCDKLTKSDRCIEHYYISTMCMFICIYIMYLIAFLYIGHIVSIYFIANLLFRLNST